MQTFYKKNDENRQNYDRYLLSVIVIILRSFRESVFQRRLIGKTFKEFAEEGWIRKVHLVGDLGNGLVRMLQFDFDVFYYGTVNPFFCGGAAGLADNGTKIALRKTHLIGIETDLVLSCCMLIYQVDKAIEDGLFSTL